jgi:hypothetical protein
MPSFFRPLEPPDPSDLPPRPPRPVWSQPGPESLGGFVPLRLELARTDDHIVLLGPMEAHPNGVDMTLEVRGRDLGIGHHPFGEPSGGELRFGVSFADGRSTEQGLPWRHGHDADVGDGPVLVPGGGGGGGHTWRHHHWLWPLPPRGPVTFHLVWPDAGIDERSVEVDAAVFVDAAAHAVQLWDPLTPEEEQAQAMAMHRRMSARGGSSFTLHSFGATEEDDDDAGGDA